MPIPSAGRSLAVTSELFAKQLGGIIRQLVRTEPRRRPLEHAP
ncbi:MAG: hypothetical protein ACREM1_21305 [Longimicrobiales bacterium]